MYRCYKNKSSVPSPDTECCFLRSNFGHTTRFKLYLQDVQEMDTPFSFNSEFRLFKFFYRHTRFTVFPHYPFSQYRYPDHSPISFFALILNASSQFASNAVPPRIHFSSWVTICFKNRFRLFQRSNEVAISIRSSFWTSLSPCVTHLHILFTFPSDRRSQYGRR